MNELLTHNRPQTPPPIEVPEEVQPILMDLETARDITLRFLRRMDAVAEAMKPEELKVALAEDGQLTLNVTRMSRALRQIAAMEQEILGLREPPASRGGGSGGKGSGSGAGGRHDFNDLADAQDINDLNDFRDMFDFDDRFDAADWKDLAAMEKYDNFEDFTVHRKHHAITFTEEDELEADRIIHEALAKMKPAPPISDEQRHKNMKAFQARLKAEHDALMTVREGKWAERREALLRLSKPQRRRARSGRGPPWW